MINNKIELKVIPLQNKMETLRLRNCNGDDICFYDPEEANDFLKCFFNNKLLETLTASEMLVAAVVFLLVISPLASKPDLVNVVSALAELVFCQLKLGVNL